jgi:hypothetical protein
MKGHPVAIFNERGEIVSHANAFPLSPPRTANQGIDPATGQPAPIGPDATMNVRSTAHGGSTRVVVAGNAAAWDSLDAGSKFQASTDLPRASGPVGTATRGGGAPIQPHELRGDDLITLSNGMTTSVAVAEKLGEIVRDPAGGYRNAGPQVIEPTPQERQEAAEVAAKAAEVAAEAAKAEQTDLNTHPHQEVEEAHASFASLPTQDAVNLLVKAHRGVAPTTADMHRIAESMNVTPDVAAERLRLMNLGVEAQFTILARGHGVDADAAADWIRTRRQSDALTAVRDHVLGRNLRAWEPLIAAYKASGGR